MDRKLRRFTTSQKMTFRRIIGLGGRPAILTCYNGPVAVIIPVDATNDATDDEILRDAEDRLPLWAIARGRALKALEETREGVVEWNG